MFVLEAKIEIGSFVFQTIHEVEIEKSVDTLADTAIIKLPTRFKVKGKQGYQFTESVIKVKDPVKITLSYKGFPSANEFIGFVKQVKPKIPLEIHCEDSFWLLRRKNINKRWESTVQLKEILEEIVKGTDLKLSDNIIELPIDNFTIRNANGAQVLQRLKQDFGLSAFITDDNKLYCGLRQLTNIGQQAKYDLGYNLVENNLEFKTSEDRKLKIRYTYIGPNGKRKKIEVGDPEGELRTYHTAVVSDVNKLKQMALSELEKLKYDGYQGDIVSFLIPTATRGMKALIVDKDYPGRSGAYFISKVKISFGTSGARRTVYLGTKL